MGAVTKAAASAALPTTKNCQKKCESIEKITFLQGYLFHSQVILCQWTGFLREQEVAAATIRTVIHIQDYVPISQFLFLTYCLEVHRSFFFWVALEFQGTTKSAASAVPQGICSFSRPIGECLGSLLCPFCIAAGGQCRLREVADLILEAQGCDGRGSLGPCSGRMWHYYRRVILMSRGSLQCFSTSSSWLQCPSPTKPFGFPVSPLYGGCGSGQQCPSVPKTNISFGCISKRKGSQIMVRFLSCVAMS